MEPEDKEPGIPVAWAHVSHVTKRLFFLSTELTVTVPRLHRAGGGRKVTS